MNDSPVLVIEDELLIGLDLVSALEEAGFTVVQHAATENEALDLIGQKRWAAVVADANLNGRSVERIATLLHRKRVPFVVVTGYDRSTLPSAIGDVPVLAKPVENRSLIRTVLDLCKRLPQETVSIPQPG